MRELEEKAAASTKSAEYERNHARQLENDLKKVCAELEDVKKIAVQNKNIAEKTIKELNAGLDRCRIGIKVMTQRIFGNFCAFSILGLNCELCGFLYWPTATPSGSASPNMKLGDDQQMNELLDYCHGLQEGAKAIVTYLSPQKKCGPGFSLTIYTNSF